MNYEQYSELLLSAAKSHKKKIKRYTKFGSKSQRSVYDLEQLPNDGNEDSFDIDSYVDMIQAYTSHQRSSLSRIPRERWYRLSQEGNIIWDKLSEADKATILGNAKHPTRLLSTSTFMMLPLVTS